MERDKSDALVENDLKASGDGVEHREARIPTMVVIVAETAEILAQAVEGPVTSTVSATAIQLHEDCKVIVDEKAAAPLKGSDYFRWIFANEPDWLEARRRLRLS